MNCKLQEKLLKDFPFMEARNVWSGKKLGFCIGCDCGDGWFNLIYDLCVNIQEELNKQSKNFIKGFYPIQIKEKYGGLRFYTTYGNNEIFDLIEEAEQKSYEICEMCGEKGKVRDGSWIRTLCDNCHIKVVGGK